MSFLLENTIFEFFGPYAKRVDVNKDGNDKGSWERYQQSAGELYDTEVQPLLDLFLDNTVVPETMLSKLIPTMERVLGEPVIVLQDGSQVALTEELRRKVIRFVHTINNIKSTRLSYDILLNLIGLTVTDIDEFILSPSEGACDDCMEYTVITTGGLTLDAPLLAGIDRIINYLEPIGANLREFTYNGTPITLGTIIIYIEDGKLFYDNQPDTGLTLQLIDGDLWAGGSSLADYTFDGTDGRLYYVTP